jgi:hypothetical protein
METRMEEIINRYIDDLNAGKAISVDVFLAQYSDLPPHATIGLRKILFILTMVRKQWSEEEQKLASWRRLEKRIRAESGTTEEAIPTLAASAAPASSTAAISPSVGDYLAQTLAVNPSALHKFAIPEEVLLIIAQDDSSLEVVQKSAEKRIQFAQRYAANDQSLLRQIGGLLTHLSRLWLSGTTRPSSSPSYTRPISRDPETN